MPLLDNSFTGVTLNVYLDNKPVDLIAPPIKPFDIELTKEFATKTQIPDNYKRAFESLQSETKSQFIPTGDTFSTKDSNVYGVQGLNFTPGVDNEGIAYLKQDNALSKGVSGMFDVAKASFFSQINTIPNLFSSIVSGEDLFRDNEQNRHLAESLRKLEEDNNKIFKSADQRENPLAPHNIFSKENFSSLLQQTGITVGTIGGILLENLALKVAEAGLVSTGGGAPAAVALEGAEDIRTAIGISKTLGTTGKAIKDILTGVSTLTKSYAAAKGINQAGQMVKALNLTELGVRAFLHANGEAALQKHIAREDIIKSLVDQEGNNLTQEKLDQIHSIAEQGSNTEYYLNLPLLMVSDMYQFGNVLMGKQLNNVLDKFPVSAKLTGGALEFSGKAPSFGRYLTNKTLDFVLKSQTEGLEEIAQYGIENFTRDYYKDLYNKKTTSTAYNFMKYLGKGAESMFNEEGLSQYISGVLIGGITNVGLGAVTSAPQIAANPKRFFTPYSSYKETIENAFSRNNTLGENTLKYFSSVAKQNDAFQQGDKAKFNDELAKQIFDFTDTSLKRGTFGHIIDTIKSWSTLENEQFNASGFAGMGENLNPDQQRTYVNSLLDKINLAKEAVENTQRVFKVNPFEKENWFVEKIKNRGKTDEEILSQDLFKAQSSHIFNQLRNVAAYLTFKKENQSTRFEGLTSELNNEFNPKFVENMLGEKPSVKNYLLDQLKQFEQELAIYEEGVDPKSINSIEGVRDRKNTLKKLIDAINSVKDKPEEELVKVMSLPEEVKGIITNAEMSIEDFNKASEKLIDSYKLKQSINVLNKIYKSWGTIEGQKELINSILDHSVYSPTETSKPQVTPKTETPETTAPRQEMSLADMLSSIPLADTNEYSIEPYYIDDEDMSFPVEEYSSSQQTTSTTQSEIEAKKADIERRRQEELTELGQKQLTKGFNSLSEATKPEQVANAIVNIEQSKNKGALLSKEQEQKLSEAKAKLKEQGYEIIDYNIVRNGENTIVQAVDFYDNEKDILTEEQANAIESKINTLEKRGEEVNVDDLPSPISRTIKPLIKKDGKMIQTAEVNTLIFESVEQAKEAIKKSREAGNKKPNAADKINAKYDAELKALEQQPTSSKSETPKGEEGSVGVGGDVESTTKALEEVSKTKPTLWEKIKEAVKSVGKKFGIVSNADHINNFNTAKAEWDKLSSREKKLKRADYELDDLYHTEGGYYKVGNSLIDLDLNPNHFKILLENNKFLNILNKLGVTKIHSENRPPEEMFAHYSDGKIHLNNNSAFETEEQLSFAMSHELGHHEWTKLTKEERDYVRSLPLETGMAKHYEAQEKNGGKQTSASLQEENFADYVMQYFQGKLYGDEALLNKKPAKLREMFDNKYSDLLKDNEHLDIAEAYHKAKKDGSNPELVKAVEQSLKETTKAEATTSNKSEIEAKKAVIERRKQALRDLMKATGDDIFMLGVEDGTFMGESLLNMNENGDVVLTRYADSEEGLTKGKGKTKNLKDIAGQFGGEQIATSGIEGGAASFTNRVVGEYHIPLQELIDLIKSEDVVFAGLGNKEFVLSPHIADKYLTKINGKQINAKYDAELKALENKDLKDNKNLNTIESVINQIKDCKS